MCLCKCVSAQGRCLGPRDLSGGITLTGEKVKSADLKRRVDNLFGQKMPKALKRSFLAEQKKKIPHIRGKETDEPDRKSAQDHHLCGSLAAEIKRKISGLDSLELPLHLLSFTVSSPRRSVEPYGGRSDSAGAVGGGGTEPGSVWPPPCCRAGWPMWHSICLWRCLERPRPPCSSRRRFARTWSSDSKQKKEEERLDAKGAEQEHSLTWKCVLSHASYFLIFKKERTTTLKWATAIKVNTLC